MDLKNFYCTEVLSKNPTDKSLILLGKVKEKQQKGEAIIILHPRTANISDQHNKQLIPLESLQQIFTNDIYGKFQIKMLGDYEIQSIFPITQKHKDKYRKKTMSLHRQTANEYQNVKQQLLEKELQHIGWVKNILEGKAEQERILYGDQSVILLPDFKFHNLQELQNLHLLCIFKDLSIHSIRDLNGSHLKLLQNVRKTLEEQIKKHFSPMKLKHCRCYFHYPPTFYQLHLHIQSLQLMNSTCNVQRCHDLGSVIENIKIMPEYYQKTTLNCLQQEKLQ